MFNNNNEIFFTRVINIYSYVVLFFHKVITIIIRNYEFEKNIYT